MRIERRVAVRVERLCGRLDAYKGTGEVVNLTNALSSLTTDVISSIIFEEPSDYLGDPNFNEEWYHTLKMGTMSIPLFQHLPWLVGYVSALCFPVGAWGRKATANTSSASVIARPLLRRLVTYITDCTIWDEKARRQVILIRKRPSDESRTRDETTVLDHLVHSDLVEKELGGNGGFARLAQLIQQAGAHNVSHTLGTIMTHLLLEPDKAVPLRKELEVVWSQVRTDGDLDGPSWLDLEKLPFLSAVIAEGLRYAQQRPGRFEDCDADQEPHQDGHWRHESNAACISRGRH